MAQSQSLNTSRAVALIVGLIVGSGIFKLPQLVALFSGSLTAFLGVWLAAGLLSVLAALCYAELSSAYPDRGGEYAVLRRAYGARPGLLFLWCRSTVMQTGAIAALAFVAGDYGVRLLGLPPQWAPALGAVAVLALTFTNWLGLAAGSRTQTVLTCIEVFGLVALIVTGLFLIDPSKWSDMTPIDGPPMNLGLALVLAMFAFGGWNEASYLSTDMEDKKRGIVRALFISVAIVTVLYLLVSVAIVNALGMAATAASSAVASDVMKAAFGPGGDKGIALIVIAAALSSINSSLITGARSLYALGRDWAPLRALGHWANDRAVPVAALWVQTAIIIALVAAAMSARSGFQAMVDYTAPVYWFFISAVILAMTLLRWRDPTTERPFRVPLFPLIPLLVLATTLYMTWSALDYALGLTTTPFALIGVAVMIIGIILMIWRGAPPVPQGETA
jgi:basic amino acid/polyamine antiporter, APA family